MQLKKVVFSTCLIFCLMLSACNLPSVKAGSTPGKTSFTNYTLDCLTSPGNPADPIQPPPNCDRWQDNRYERPFNASKQDIYAPDMDILFGALGRSGDWFFARIALDSLAPGAQALRGSYGIEIDTDRDFRGDYLVVGTPQIHPSPDWNPLGVQVWHDRNNDVGNQIAGQPDGPYSGDGYDELLYDPGQQKTPPSVFMRANRKGDHVYLDLAFQPVLIENAGSFYWWAWADDGIRQVNSFDYHDMFDLPTAGEVYQGQPNFPAKAISVVDNTCADAFGVEPPQGDTHFCIGDPSVSYIPPGGGCEDPNIQDTSILCPSGTSTPEFGTETQTATITPTCPGYSISIHSPTPGGPTPCGSPPPCPHLSNGQNTPDPNACTPTLTPTVTQIMTLTVTSTCPAAAAAANTRPCQTGTPTPTATLPCPNGIAGASANTQPCQTGTATLTMTPPCPNSVAGASASGGCTSTPTATIHITFTMRPPTRTPRPHATKTPCPVGAGGCN